MKPLSMTTLRAAQPDIESCIPSPAALSTPWPPPLVPNTQAKPVNAQVFPYIMPSKPPRPPRVDPEYDTQPYKEEVYLNVPRAF